MIPLPLPHLVAVWPFIQPAYSAQQVKAYHARCMAEEGHKLGMIAELTQALADACAAIEKE